MIDPAKSQERECHQLDRGWRRFVSATAAHSWWAISSLTEQWAHSTVRIKANWRESPQNVQIDKFTPRL
jgi:hypothetical protein